MFTKYIYLSIFFFSSSSINKKGSKDNKYKLLCISQSCFMFQTKSSPEPHDPVLSSGAGQQIWAK